MDDPRKPNIKPLTEAELAAVPAIDPFKDDGECVMPVPANASPMPLVHPKWGKPSATWTYRDASGETLFCVSRFDLDGKHKQFLPQSLWRESSGALRWWWKGVLTPRPLYGLDKLAGCPGASVIICEGEKAVDAAAKVFPRSVCITSPSGSQAAAKADWSPLAGRRVMIWPDADEPGEKYAGEVGRIVSALGCEVSIVDAVALASLAPDGGQREPVKGWDAADAIDEWENLGALRKAAHGLAKPFEPGAHGAFEPFEGDWPEPKPLPDGLLSVAAFDPAFLPKAIGPWVMDISDRMQCPPDFVGIPAIVALGSVIGRKVAIRPQRKTDWLEVANLWACIVGRPGAMKSPAMTEALKSLHRLEAEARKTNEVAAKAYAIEAETFKLRKEAAQKKGRAAIKGGATDLSSFLAIEEPEEPEERRYVVNDATYEALGVILADNPNGVLAFRDELVSLLKTLDREEHVAARGFFLSAWNGSSSYTFDRIIRGKTHIEAACLSLLGSTQPRRLAEYMRGALSGGAGDDGMVQRFSLLVWPDQSPEWHEVDRYPASEPREAAWNTFQRLDELTPDGIGAATDKFASIPYLRFDKTAQGIFSDWHLGLETRLRSNELTPALESHLAKYRKLVPALALINHLADGGAGSISETAIVRALSFVEYLETHARRAYAAGSQAETAAAKAILSHIRKGNLQDGFTARDIHQHAWSNLSDGSHVKAGLDLLVDFDWIAAKTAQTGGRPRVVYSVNPRSPQ